VLAADRVDRRRLEGPPEVLPLRDLADVDRLDDTAGDQPLGRIARGGDHVVLAAAALQLVDEPQPPLRERQRYRRPVVPRRHDHRYPESH